MHFKVSHDFSDWLFKLFSSVTRKTALGSFINIFQSKLHGQHQPKLFSMSFSVKNICQITNHTHPSNVIVAMKIYIFKDLNFCICSIIK